MGALDPNRRSALAGLGALVALVRPIPARAVPGVTYGDASRIGAPSSGGYLPPASLQTVLDNFRRMTCPVTIGGAGPFGFIVDTGANQSVIAAELAQQLSLLKSDEQLLNGVAGVEMTPTVQTTLKLGNRAPREVTLSVLPAAAIGGQGMLGLDQLDGARITLDFARSELFLDSGPPLPGAGPIYDMPAQRRDGRLCLVDAEVAGVEVTAFIDSGSEDTIGNMALRALAYSRYPDVPWRVTPIISVTGQTIAADYADLPSLRIGDVTLPSWPVAFADLHTFRMWNLIRRPAILIGVDVLSRFQSVCLDYRKDVVRFRLSDQA